MSAAPEHKHAIETLISEKTSAFTVDGKKRRETKKLFQVDSTHIRTTVLLEEQQADGSWLEIMNSNEVSLQPAAAPAPAPAAAAIPPIVVQLPPTPSLPVHTPWRDHNRDHRNDTYPGVTLLNMSWGNPYPMAPARPVFGYFASSTPGGWLG